LKNERLSLLTELTSYISSLSADFESKSDPKSVERPPLVNNMSRTVNDIVWARQMKSSKVMATQKVAESLFADLGEIDEFRSVCKDLISDIDEYESRTYKKWLSEVQNLLNNKRESLELTGRIMEIEKVSGVLKVKYNEKKIVTLIKDVRQLTELGHKIPKDLNQIIENVRKFYREGVTLRQVANFFNNMSSEIMECHATMLLRPTVAFEKIISSKAKGGKDAFGNAAKDVTWTSPVELEEYIQAVQEASNVLIKENRKVRKMHMNIVENITAMMNTDLLKNRDSWKEKFDTIKRIIDTSTYSSQETKAWRKHLDYQLYKALDTQYQTGLNNLNENFNIIEADLVYTDKNV